MLSTLYAPAAAADETRGITWEQAAAAGLLAAPTAAGVSVTPENSLTCSPVFAAVRIISAAVGTLPLCLYRKLPDGGRERATSHPVYTVLHDAPNAAAVPFVFWSAFVANMLLRGKGLAEIERNGAGDVVALHLLPSHAVDYMRTPAGELFFRVKGNGRSIDLSADEVFHVPYFSLDGETGTGVIEYARETVGNIKAVESGGSAFIANMVRPSGSITVPPGLSETARHNLRESVTKANAGHRVSGRLMLLEDGVKFDPFTVTNNEAQWIEARSFGVQETARFFSISPTKLADLGRATWGNIESENRSFFETTLLPVTTPITQETKKKLLIPADRVDHYAEHVAEARLRGNTAERLTGYKTGVDAGIYTRAECRQWENLPFIAGTEKILTPLNQVADPAPPAKKDAAHGNDGNPQATDPADGGPV